MAQPLLAQGTAITYQAQGTDFPAPLIALQA